ncbi:Tyrosine N-monooxygenase [Hordeum vulgare]|nr:Tyrosine N-monooxygenase [Hordeum vulgare]
MDDLGGGWRRADARREATSPLSMLPNAAVAKKGKVSGKKNKAVDGSFRQLKKRLARRTKDVAATEAPTSSLAAPAADAHMVVDEMPTRWAAALKAVDTLNLSGTNDRDRLTIAQNLFQEEEKKTKKGKIKKGRPFTLPHCYDALKDDEKWKPREGVNEESNKCKRTSDLDDEKAREIGSKYANLESEKNQLQLDLELKTNDLEALKKALEDKDKTLAEVQGRSEAAKKKLLYIGVVLEQEADYLEHQTRHHGEDERAEAQRQMQAHHEYEEYHAHWVWEEEEER